MENTRAKILFVTGKAERCGVADYGKRLYAILKDHLDITFCEAEQESDINYTGYDIAIYNYHYATLPFISSSNRTVKHIALFHEAHMNFSPDRTVNVADLPRPLTEGRLEPVRSLYKDTPLIGSFGFGFPGKGFSRICNLVKEQFTKAIVRFNIPFAHYGDNDGHHALSQADKCSKILEGTDIKLEVVHQFLPQRWLLDWLSFNDINLFLYQSSTGRGLSSATDYALSVRRPIGISSSEMFRHLPREICLDNISIPELIAKGIEPLKQVYEDNSNARLIEKIKLACG